MLKPAAPRSSGVVVFNAFDAGLRGAVAHEVQDHSQGHPQQRGVYRYHSLSTCVEDSGDASGHSDLLGYAFARRRSWSGRRSAGWARAAAVTMASQLSVVRVRVTAARRDRERRAERRPW